MASEKQATAARGPDIFVGGPPRSGTTILQRVLCQSQYTNPMVGEAEHFFQLIQVYGSAFAQHESKTKYYFSKDELFQYHRKLAEDYLERFRSNFGDDTRLVLKVPWFTKFFPLTAEFLPSAQFVIIARDPLDIAASQIEVGLKQVKELGQNFYPRENMQSIIDGINSVYGPALANRKLFKGRLITVRYENLVSGDVALKRLTRFLQLPDLISAAKETDNGLKDIQHGADDAFYSKLWEQDLTNSRIGRHREVLTTKEIAAVKDGTKELRKLFGYE